MEPGNEQIFISIASYRDSQLIPTVEDLVDKADEPELLRFGICWQHGAEQTSLPFAAAPGIRILDVPWQQSRGACWARAEAMKLWQGEQWFLQIDSHCRFAPGWDTKLVRMMQQTGSERPILSTYANSFTPAADGTRLREFLQGTPQLIALSGFANDGLPKLKPLEIPGYAAYQNPVAARFVAGGFLFAPGSFVEDVPYDPDLYFFGEEIAMTLRAFTSGYDLFHPVETVVWHDYVRAYATRHWDEQKTDDEQVEKQKPHDQDPDVAAEEAIAPPAWRDLDDLSRARVRSLLKGEGAGERFGLGISRTLADYEAYTGLSFYLRRMQDYTRRALEPPNPPAPDTWPEEIYTWMLRVTVDRAALSPCAFEESGFWVVAIQDEDHHEFDRYDFTKEELSAIGSETQILLIREIHSGIIPDSWTVQPFGKTLGWGSKIAGKFTEADFSIILEEPAASAT